MDARSTAAVDEVDLGPLPHLLGYALRRAQLAVFADFHEQLAGEDIRPGQYSVLQVLRANPGARQAQVAAALGIKRANFVPLFDGLERRGLVERRCVPGDRRSSALHLSDLGVAALARFDALVAEHEARFVDRLGGEAVKRDLIAVLRRLAKD